MAWASRPMFWFVNHHPAAQPPRISAARTSRVNRPTPNQRQNPDMTVPGVMSVLMLRFSRPGLAPKWRPPGLIAAGQVARRGRRRRRRGPHRGSCKSRGHLVQVPYEAGGGPLAGSGPAGTLGQRVAGAEHLECPGLPRFLPPVVLGPELHGPFVAAGSDGHRAAGEREDVRLIVYGHLVAVHLAAGHDAATFRS